MLRTRNDQPSLWESALPEVCLRLPAELERVDAWLDDERFFARGEAELRELGAKTVAIPRKGQPGAARRATEHSRGFRDLIKWRTGCEGRISHLKHRYGWARSGVAGRDRTAAWCGQGVFVHNLAKITALVAS